MVLSHVIASEAKQSIARKSEASDLSFASLRNDG